MYSNLSSPKRPLSCAHTENDGQHDEAVREEPDDHRHEVQSELAGHDAQVIHLQDLYSKLHSHLTSFV